MTSNGNHAHRWMYFLFCHDLQHTSYNMLIVIWKVLPECTVCFNLGLRAIMNETSFIMIFQPPLVFLVHSSVSDTCAGKGHKFRKNLIIFFLQYSCFLRCCALHCGLRVYPSSYVVHIWDFRRKKMFRHVCLSVHTKNMFGWYMQG